MNLVLFDPEELARPLSRDDRRAHHLLEILRVAVGGTFDAGVVNGAQGKATVTAISPQEIAFSFAPTQPPNPISPIVLIVGLPRPQTARDILRDATTMGVAAIHFVRTDKGDPNYGQSTLWSSGEWRRQVIAGAEQAFATQLPEITFGHTLISALAMIARASSIAAGVRLALDNYESSRPFPPSAARGSVVAQWVTLAIGAERGWSATERDLLRTHRFELVHLGPRILRTETAVVAALALCAARTE